MAWIVSVAVAWSRVAARTAGIASKLGLELIAFKDRFPYASAFRRTLAMAGSWESVVIQLPPGPALAGMLLARGLIRNFKLICDAHTGMIVFRDAKQALLNSPFIRLLDKCDWVLAHNRDNAEILETFGVRNHTVIYDPVPEPSMGKRPSLNVGEGEFIVLPAGWDSDEPFDYLLSELGSDAYSSLGYELVITGDFTRTRLGLRYSALLSGVKGVILTGYLPSEEYAWLLRNSAAVLGITKSGHIMLRAFWEAAAYGKPVIAPRTRVTVEVMGEFPYYYHTYVRGSLRDAVDELRKDLAEASRRAALLAHRLRELSESSMRRLRKIVFGG